MQALNPKPRMAGHEKKGRVWANGVSRALQGFVEFARVYWEARYTLTYGSKELGVVLRSSFRLQSVVEKMISP